MKSALTVLVVLLGGCATGDSRCLGDRICEISLRSIDRDPSRYHNARAEFPRSRVYREYDQGRATGRTFRSE